MKQIKQLMQLLLLVLVVGASYLGFMGSETRRITTPQVDAGPRTEADPEAPQASERLLRQAFEKRQSHLQVRIAGRVAKLLSDDLDGSRHQRFILQLASGHSLLVAHNIDLAPRIDGLAAGDRIELYGEYEWNQRGGVIHWTHRDPRGSHADGWIRYQGRLYQ